MNDNKNIWSPPEPAEPVTPTGPVRRAAGTDKAKLAGALILGGIAGAAILGPLSALAASPAPAAAATTPSTGTGSAGTSEAAEPSGDLGKDGYGPGGPGGHNEAVTDGSVVAKAIGITEAQLQTALAGGQTVAQVAAGHNVKLQTVVDALVADGQSELDAAVRAGTLTQAQTDAEKSELVQRATDQANGSFPGGRH